MSFSHGFLTIADLWQEAKITFNYFIFNGLILEVLSKAVDSSSHILKSFRA